MFRRATLLVCVAAAIVATSACRETGTIRVNSIKFNGVEGVDEGALKGALATKASSKFFFGTKRFFDRGQFENDLKRISAFYSDRGYPHARITNFDVKLNDKQDAVDVTLTMDEGDPVLVEDFTMGLAHHARTPPEYGQKGRADSTAEAARQGHGAVDARNGAQRIA